jgi:hypothetical protein
MYSEGHTNEVDQNDSEAFSWGIKAAEQGRASAQNFIAKLYFKGIGVEEDKGEAFAWCRKAAEQGDASAQAVLDGFSEAAKNDAGNRHRSNAQNITLQNPEKIRPNSGGTSLKISNKENTISGHLVPAKETQGNKIWETVLNLALSTLANFSAEKINDPVFMRKSLGRAHGLLPFVIRVVVTEDMFFNFCFDRRSFLIDKLHSGNTVLTRSEEKNILPSNDEKPWISPETQVINTVDRYSGKMFADNNFYFFPRLDFEKFNNAFESYIQEALEKNGIYSKEKGFLSLALKATGLTKGALPEALGIPLVMYNETAFGSCKTGFVLTTKFFIVKEMVTKPVIIKLGQIESIELANGFLSSGKILVNGNTLLNCTQGKKESLRNFVEMFEEIISIMDGV